MRVPRTWTVNCLSSGAENICKSNARPDFLPGVLLYAVVHFTVPLPFVLSAPGGAKNYLT